MDNAKGLVAQPSCTVAESAVEWVDWGEPWDGEPGVHFVQRRRDAEESYRMNEGMLASSPPAEAGLAAWHHAENVSAFLVMAITARFLYSVEAGTSAVEILSGCNSWADALIEETKKLKWIPGLSDQNIHGGTKSHSWDFPYVDLFSADIEPRARLHLQRLIERALGCTAEGCDFAEASKQNVDDPVARPTQTPGQRRTSRHERTSYFNRAKWFRRELDKRGLTIYNLSGRPSPKTCKRVLDGLHVNDDSLDSIAKTLNVSMLDIPRD